MASKSLGTIGKANLNIVPKFDNLGSTVKKTLDGIDTSSSGAAGGSAYGESFTVSMGSMLGGGAIAGVMASITSEVTNVLSNAVAGAISRFDTLNNYPLVMQSLGYSAEDAEDSIDKMSTRLTGLPTALNDMTSTVQGIAAITGDLDLSTEAGLALNDMLLASGSSTQSTSAAMEQFRQILAKGKPDMQDWKSLTQTMPGQMNQLAEEMLGAGATADDLYHALGGGGEEATITTDELLRAMIKLDQEGGDGITSFSEQAKVATGGVQTSLDNMEIGVERGLANIMDSIGRENITGAISGIGDAFEGALNVIAGAIDTCRPLIDAFMGAIEAIGPYAAPAIEALGGFATLSFGVSEGVGAISRVIGNTSNIFGPASTMASNLSDAFFNLAYEAEKSGSNAEGFLNIATAFSGAEGGAIMAGVGVIAGVVATLAWTFYDAWEKQEEYIKGTEGLKDATANVLQPTENLADAYETMGEDCDNITLSTAALRDELDKARESHANIVDDINERTEDLNRNIGQIDSYMGVIDDYAFKSDVIAENQEKLKWALDKVNEACGTQYDVVEDTTQIIDNETGDILENTDAIKDNTEELKRNMRQQALLDDYDELWDQYLEDVDNVEDAQKKVNEAQEKYNAAVEAGTGDQEYWSQQLEIANSDLEEARKTVNDSKMSLNNLNDQLYEVDSGIDVFVTDFKAMGGDVDQRCKDMCGSVDNFAIYLRDAGINEDALRDITAEDFDRMYDECDGNIGLMIGKIAEYNGIELDEKQTAIICDYSSVKTAEDLRKDWNEGDWIDHYAQANIKVTTNFMGDITDYGGLVLEQRAAGGIRTHSHGAIATSAVPLDIVGEAGAEAIVPLTNRQYSLPFAQLIAEEIGELEGAGNTIYNNTYYLDGIQITGSDADELESLLGKYVTMGTY